MNFRPVWREVGDNTDLGLKNFTRGMPTFAGMTAGKSKSSRLLR